jgi:hypothetical protein
VTQQQRETAESILANDEASTDVELLEHFTSELGLTMADAGQMVGQRTSYLNGNI